MTSKLFVAITFIQMCMLAVQGQSYHAAPHNRIPLNNVYDLRDQAVLIDVLAHGLYMMKGETVVIKI